ncbi:YcaO-like family protein [Streptomyces caniscabiei]|uniref:YcaO-like family protein n=1 Tax=Streptomyces caniscabiei TaxID=2746961 RepID=UPI0029BBA9DE|nr:YcaO-like family protein [Streptomyces caniscabiei]MDX2775774.1 YcaO-like family protein [Streptomyces caniscabiei]
MPSALKEESPYRPLHRAPAVQLPDSAIQFTLPDGTTFVTRQYTQLVWAILRRAVGIYDVAQLVNLVHEEYPAVTSDKIHEAVQQLIRLNVLVDAAAALSSQHAYSNNPTSLSPALSDEAIRRHAASARTSVDATIAVHPVRQRATALSSLQSSRRSQRQFSKGGLTGGALGHILTSAYSLTLHAVPSAGGLYPLKVYVVLTRPLGKLSAGYYEYDPERDLLAKKTNAIDSESLQYCFNDTALLGNAPVIIVIAADFERSTYKYGSRGYRFTLLEAGHVAQNIHLAAAEEKLSTLEYGGFLDAPLAAELTMNSGSGKGRIAPIISIAVGKKSQKSTPDISRTAAELQQVLEGGEKIVQSMSVTHMNDVGVYFAQAIVEAPEAAVDEMYTTAGVAFSSDLAKIKALAEAYERHAASLVRVEKTASALELSSRGQAWFDPRLLAPSSAGSDPLTVFDEDAPWQWVKGTIGLSKKQVWVPVDATFYPVDTRKWNRHPCIYANSSGVAAYADMTGAVERGLLELLERHCLMTTWHTQQPPKRVPTKLLSLHWRRRVASWRRQHRDVHVLDISSGYGEVTVKVVIVSSMYPHYVNGAASSFTSFDHALEKAFLEAEVGIDAMAASPRKPFPPHEVVSVSDHADFYAAAAPETLSWQWSGAYVAELPLPTSTSDALLGQLECVVVRLSPPEAPLAVARVISPRLVPIGFGFGQTHHLHASLAGVVSSRSLSMPHDFA